MKTRGFGRVGFLVTLASLMPACASGLTGAVPASQRVIAYPPDGKSAEAASKDKAECEAWAQQETGYQDPAAEGLKEGVTWGAIGALGGAALGAAIGAISGDSGRGAVLGAITGAGAGGLSQGLNTANAAQYRYENAYGLCMRARGYQITH